MKRSLFRYFGGKWRVAPWIVSFFPPHQQYVEPFAGAASVLFKKERCYSETINDLNEEVINFYRVLQDEQLSSRLETLIRLTPYSRNEYILAHGKSDEPVERARRLLIRSLMSYNATSMFDCNSQSGFRMDTKKRYSIPSHDWARYPDNMALFINRLRGVTVENTDAFNLIERTDDPDTLFYLDPPYVEHTRTDKNKNQYAFEFSDEDHKRLVDVILSLRGMVIISGYDSPLYQPLEAAGWRKEQKTFQINYSGSRVECLWIKPIKKVTFEF